MAKNNVLVTFVPATATQRAFIDSDSFKIEHHDEGLVEGLSFLLKIPIPDHFSLEYPLSKLFKLALDVKGGFKETFKWLISAPGDLNVKFSPNEANGSVSVDLIGLPADPEGKLSLLSITGIGNIDVSKINCLFRLTTAAVTLATPPPILSLKQIYRVGKSKWGFQKTAFYPQYAGLHPLKRSSICPLAGAR